ncbi:ecdysteroid UDP-glucosyltransferase [Orgyia leucostigma nucleopolyhedrovirus]|uniref:Ecdysteroid UDP-glucosyltransferase n=1 Tax=Orgyia leucostigma nucleopolyhedrovirus TaxID=490711 RepID=B0FDZ8_9ABAC|nr:ecdysteroid UDP-glucosyltransferase [Orgyia leucostigma nucleopolyhedrovirus]ABY65856.1 ecdysteroid UDP-glucosyltransferase [Orgyia leucostigma nucleopolyhedrovirus]
MSLILFPLLMWLAETVHCSRILAVFPTPSYSHQSVFKVYVETLAERGHELVVVRPLMHVNYKQPLAANITHIDATLSEKYFASLIEDSAVFRKRGMVADSSTVTARNYMGLVRMISEQLDLPAVQTLIKYKTHFDLLITEAFIDYPLILSHLLGDLPVVQISSGYGVAENFETMGAVARHPIFYPNMWRSKFRNLNTWEIIAELYTELRLQNEFNILAEEQNKLLKQQFGESSPTVQELRGNVQLLLVNIHAVFDNNRPVPPSVQYLGGLHLHDKKIGKLNSYVQTFLDNSTNGVVYVSFGSGIDARNMDREFVNMLLDTFNRIPFDVAWKFDGEIEANRVPSNVLIQAWFDQYTLLHHKNVKTFVTQGGVQSTDEAIDALVPLVGMPMMGDQAFNTNKYEELGIGCAVDTLTVTGKQLSAAIILTAVSTEYRNNLKHLRHSLNHQAMSPAHKAVWYTEHIIGNKGKQTHLKTRAANVTYSEYFMIYIMVPLITMTAMNHIQQLLRVTFF